MSNAVATHEAGHCVVALVLGRSYGCALFDSGDVGGLAGGVTPASFTPPTPEAIIADALSRDRLDAFDQATISAAGLAAEFVAQGLYLTPTRGAGGDSERIEELCRRFMGQDFTARGAGAFGMLAHERATSIIRRHWEGVRAVADALHTRRRLSAAEVALAFAAAEK